jgi:hypothetical protein
MTEKQPFDYEGAGWKRHADRDMNIQGRLLQCWETNNGQLVWIEGEGFAVGELEK